MTKLVCRVKLVAELQARETAEVEVARIERDQQADLSDLGPRLAEAKQLTFALQAEIIPAQVKIAGGGMQSWRGHYVSHATMSTPFARRKPG
jgi:hypothetical protein